MLGEARTRIQTDVLRKSSVEFQKQFANFLTRNRPKKDGEYTVLWQYAPKSFNRLMVQFFCLNNGDNKSIWFVGF